MFTRSFPKDGRVNKIRKPAKKSVRDDAKLKLHVQATGTLKSPPTTGLSPRWNGRLWQILVGPQQRTFAAYEDHLRQSHVLGRILARAKSDGATRITLDHEDPEVFACILEYLYTADYTPNLEFDEKRRTWCMDETTPRKTADGHFIIPSRTVKIHELGDEAVLRDAAVYCAARKFGLDDLMRKAAVKLSKCSGGDIPIVTRSMRYAYERTTADRDGTFRAHFLAIIVRHRNLFRLSGTLQKEMIRGGEMYFDLFVAMTSRLNDLEGVGSTYYGSVKSSSTLVG